MLKGSSLWGRWKAVCLLPVLLTVYLAGCTPVKFIAEYDQVTDETLMTIQQKTDDFIAALIKQSGTEAAAFDKHQEFYEDIDKDLRRLEFRTGTIPYNNLTEEHIDQIRMVILGEGLCSDESVALRDLHCWTENSLTGPSEAVLGITRRNINQTIGAALRLELEKKAIK